MPGMDFRKVPARYPCGMSQKLWTAGSCWCFLSHAFLCWPASHFQAASPELGLHLCPLAVVYAGCGSLLTSASSLQAGSALTLQAQLSSHVLHRGSAACEVPAASQACLAGPGWPAGEWLGPGWVRAQGDGRWSLFEALRPLRQSCLWLPALPACVGLLCCTIFVWLAFVFRSFGWCWVVGVLGVVACAVALMPGPGVAVAAPGGGWWPCVAVCPSEMVRSAGRLCWLSLGHSG